jgi:peroxiredoxin Q/BCP
MAQLRQDYEKFTALNAEIIIVGPDGPNAFRRFWNNENMPYIGLPDIKSRVADHFEQEVNLFKFGRMPAIFVIDKQGIIQYSHYGSSMSDIPENQIILDVLGRCCS